MNAVILGCSSMAKAIDAAQKKTGTDHPVYLISRKYHSSPGQMRLHLMEALHTIPESSDTVLVAMGFCGGSWKDIDTEKRIVIPKVDDCITLMLHTDDSPHFNLKQATHLYMRDPYGDDFGPMHEKLRMKYGEEKVMLLLHAGLSLLLIWISSTPGFVTVTAVHLQIRPAVTLRPSAAVSII